MAITAKKKKVSAPRLPKTYDTQYMGEEPTWKSPIEASRNDIQNAYNWYNYFYDTKSAFKFLTDNYPRDKKELKLLKKLPIWKIPSVLCFHARMKARGFIFPVESTQYFNKKIDELLLEAKNIRTVKEEKKLETAKPSIQDRIREQINEYIGELEEVIDSFVANKCNTEFEIYGWLQKNEVKGQQSNAIASYFKKLESELKECVTTKDAQLTEAYSFLKKSELKRYLEFVSSLVADAESWVSNQKKVRQVRKKKPVSTEKMISKLQFLKSFDELKLVSIDPTDIIGAHELWVYNVKYRQLTRYVGMAAAGFSVKGTTLVGYDPDKSVRKAIRKPEESLPRVLSGGKRVLNKIMDELTTKAADANGRINIDTILLKAMR